MRPLSPAALACTALALAASMLWPGAAAAGDPAVTRVLFVGNSLTFYNDLPGTFAAVHRAAAPGVPVQADMLATGGATLGDRLADGRLAAMLKAGDYDLVVLQQIGGWPLCDASEDGCEPAARLVEAVQLVRTHGARPLWLATWKTSPAQQERLSTTASRLARGAGVDLVDTGAAMQRMPDALQRHLLVSDGHPDVLGTWLMAALVVRAVSSTGLPRDPPPSNCDTAGAQAGARPAASTETVGGEPCHALTGPRWRAVRNVANRAASRRAD